MRMGFTSILMGGASCSAYLNWHWVITRDVKREHTHCQTEQSVLLSWRKCSHTVAAASVIILCNNFLLFQSLKCKWNIM